jgi:hypothetical protein
MSGTTGTRDRLAGALDRARRSVRQVRDRKEHIGEAQTKASLISPVLAALGWDTTDLDEVSLEYRHKPQDNPVDYALFLHRSPRLFVEAKALDTNLDDHKWRSQTVNYANAAGVEWCVLTDGNHYWIYNAHAPVAVEQKLFRTVTIAEAETDDRVLDTLLLLSKEKLSGKIIDELWKAHFIDRSVQGVLDGLFDDLDAGLVNAIRKRTPELLPAQIRDSLRRADVRIDFPVLTATDVPHVPPPPGDEAPPVAGHRVGARDRGSWTRVSDLIAAGLVKPGDEWRLKTASVEATLQVQGDGTLLVNGQSYGSPSAAGQAVTGWRSCDGWRVWEYQDGAGNWAPVDVLRKRLSGEEGRRASADELDGRRSAPNGQPSPSGEGGAVDDRLAGKPTAQALFRVLAQRTQQAVGEFAIHANSKHIILSNRYAFAAISVLHSGLRIGLRLDSSAVERHPRLRAQPRGVFEGWNALHVSTAVSSEAEIDQELVGLLKTAHGAAE